MIFIELSKRFKKIVREAGREEEVSSTLKLVLAGFGNPHAHSGLAIRKLGRQLYECRTGLLLVGLALRISTAPTATKGLKVEPGSYGSVRARLRISSGLAVGYWL